MILLPYITRLGFLSVGYKILSHIHCQFQLLYEPFLALISGVTSWYKWLSLHTNQPIKILFHLLLCVQFNYLASDHLFIALNVKVNVLSHEPYTQNELIITQ